MKVHWQILLVKLWLSVPNQHDLRGRLRQGVGETALLTRPRVPGCYR